ncbi:MAG: ABC transporter permease [Thermincolia bacterium]
MTFEQLTFTLAFVALAIGLSVWQHLGLHKDIIIGSLRAAVQLIAVGYVLQLVFSLHSWPFMVLMVGVMILVAALNIRKRGEGLPGVLAAIIIALVLTEVLSMLILLGLEIIKPIPQYVIPISGMIVGNAMVVCGLLLNRMKAEVAARRPEIEVALSLGATPKEAVMGVLKNAIRAAMIPSIDSMKTLGLVQLPGMMTGQIIN